MLTRPEFWLLDSAVTFAVDLSVLVSPNIEAALNQETHGLSRGALVEVLLGLFAKGLISGTRDDVVVALDAANIELGLSGRGPRVESNTYYRLTAKGGAAWEELALPDWSRFVEGYEANGERVAEASTVDLARESFAEDWPPFAHIPDASQAERLCPWSATYWKRLPTGFRIRGRIPPLARSPSWLTQKDRVWYTQPSWDGLDAHGHDIQQ